MSKKNKNRQLAQQTEELENNPINTEDNIPVEDTNLSIEEENVQEENLLNNEQQNVPENIQEEEQQVEVKQEEQIPVVEEIKPVSNKGVLIVERKPVAQTVAESVSPGVEQFNKLTEQYITLMRNEAIGDDERRKAVLLLTAIGNHVIMSSDTRVFEACFSFFLKNRAIMLVPERVTDGLYKFVDKAKVTKLIQWYITFQSLVESKLLKINFTLNLTTIRRTFNNDALANWLIIKKK